MNFFEADDRCFHCKKLILMEHETFLFLRSPEDIAQEIYCEWQPSPDEPTIPLDVGPARVAYPWSGESYPEYTGQGVVQVHEGDSEGLWVPCSAVTISPGVWGWVCQPMAPKNPADNDWMKSISS